MTFQYGDSKTSSLRINYIDFLRVAIGQSVAIVRAEGVMADLRQRRAARERQAEELVARLEELGKAAMAALDPVSADDSEPHTRRLREGVVRAVRESVAREVAGVKRLLAEDVARFQTSIGDEQRRVIRALEALIVNEDLPGATGEVHVALTPDGTYNAGWLARTDYGIEILVELEIPEDSPFSHDLRVAQINEQLEIHAPQAAGWLRKETKMVPHRAGKLHVVGVGVSQGRVKIMLRSAADVGSSGYNVSVNRKSRAVEIARVDGEPAPFDVDPGDVPALLALSDHLTEEAQNLRGHRSALLKVSLDGISLAEHSQPSELVARLMRATAPIVNEIARHSPPGELVLRRRLAENRREEVFVTKQELLDRIAELPEERQSLFEPLGLDQTISVEEESGEIVLFAEDPEDGDAGSADTDHEWDMEESTAVLLGSKRLHAQSEAAPEAAGGDEADPAAEPTGAVVAQAPPDSAATVVAEEDGGVASDTAGPKARPQAGGNLEKAADPEAEAAPRRSPGTVPPPRGP